MDKLGPYQLNSIITGDAKILAKEIPDESVDLIFTDPVYDRIEDYGWLGYIAQRILKSDGHLLVYVTQQHFLDQANAIRDYLQWSWLFGVLIAGRRVPMWQKRIQSLGQFIAWFAKGSFNHNEWANDFAYGAYNFTRGHKWRKGMKEVSYYVHAFSPINGIICDPFCGGASIVAVCKMLTRNYLAFEIDPETADLARQQVAQTQPPLFVPEPQQLDFLSKQIGRKGNA